LKIFFQGTTNEQNAVPAAVIAIQSFGDFLGFNPHLHVLASDGCFYENGMFRVAPRFHTKDLEKIFRHKVFKMLLSKGKITEDLFNGDGSSKEYRKNWARLIQKIYEVNPLTCPKCQDRMRILAFIEDEEVIKKILKHLGLWEVTARPPPKTKDPPLAVYIDYSDSQVLPSEDHLYIDPD
jgi:hypothetical protein